MTNHAVKLFKNSRDQQNYYS